MIILSSDPPSRRFEKPDSTPFFYQIDDPDLHALFRDRFVSNIVFDKETDEWIGVVNYFPKPEPVFLHSELSPHGGAAAEVPAFAQSSTGVPGAFLGFIGIISGSMLGVAFVLNINGIKQILESTTGATLFDPMIYFLTSLPSEPDVAEIISIVGPNIDATEYRVELCAALEADFHHDGGTHVSSQAPKGCILLGPHCCSSGRVVNDGQLAKPVTLWF